MTQKNNLKPIEVDAHFKYRCPKCGWDRWISLKEAQTKNFKIVCDCNTTFKPKRIKNIGIKYYLTKMASIASISDSQTHNKSIDTPLTDQIVLNDKIPEEPKPIIAPIETTILEKCSKLLMQYGFTNNEARALIEQAYSKVMINDIGILVKTSLQILGDNKHE